MPFKGELRPFQIEGFERMLKRKHVLLAYDMGLGKTTISIAAIEDLLDKGAVERGLVISPASLKYQWQDKIDEFTGGAATVQVIDGTPTQRLEQYGKIREAEYIILSYEQVVNDWKTVRKLPADFIVVDECAAIKNFKPKRSKRIKRLRKAEYLFGLTGQPVEDRPEEIYSILQWIDPDVLGRWDIFDSLFIERNQHGWITGGTNLHDLHRRLQDVMVRKRQDDEDVKDQLPEVMPPKTYYIDFDPRGARLYRHIVSDLISDLDVAAQRFGSFDLSAYYSGTDQAQDALRGAIMSKLSCLRMLCDHPDLLRLSAQRHADPTLRKGSVYAAHLNQHGLLTHLGQYPKFKEACSVVGSILEASPKNKVVLFSYFKPTLTWLKQEIESARAAPRGQAVLFTGDMTAKEKEVARQKFETDPEVRVFLSSDAGGQGVDLPSANYLINYDLPWSAGKLDQRNSRIIRLSSKHKKVMFINLLMRGSIEQRQVDIHNSKQRISDAIVDGKGIDQQGGLKLDISTLRQFLINSRV